MKPRNRREERMLAVLERETPRYQTRKGRRRLVVAAAGCLGLMWAAAVVCWYLAPSTAAMVTTFVLCGLALVVGAQLWGMLHIVTRGTASLPEHLLDERQVRERLSAHPIAHRLTLLLLLAVFLAVGLALQEERPEVPSAAAVVLLFALMATVWSLPMLVTAWRMADPPPEEEAV
ncbi:hypothetical protein Acsp04_53710 [Actinomadura sp. NBRC 104425]|uniref:hypothetical protein n=1 Tax=Actinomadura sp. NBRC 104425 TaxID=3032204 RepID=UPI00249FA668|nr:hypothetical protein [Actinomadura sp. NBRC 104425]GLZ15136.1 hypothetical protein Acsp04_53710 [Actinomadura sp. NBRC 104425]